MDLKGAYAFTQALESKISEVGMESYILEGIRSPQIGDTLRILMPVTAEGHPVISEFMLTELADDYHMLILYTTVLASIKANKEKLPATLIDWNLACPMGHYGVYEEENQLYHKYSLPFPVDTDPVLLAAQAMDLLTLVYELLSAKYPDFLEFTGKDDTP